MHLVYSNRVEELAGTLAERVAGERDLFSTVTVLVPNAMVAAYVRLELARRLGVAANLRLAFLEGFLAELVERARPEWRVLDRRMIQAGLVGLLSDPARIDGEEMAPVRDYLAGGGAMADVRRVQLAGELAALFVDYSLARPEMIAAWSRAGGARGEVTATEAWQRRLWRELFPPASATTSTSAQTGPLAPLAARIAPGDLAPPATLHMFGFSTLARAYQPILARVAAACELHIYQLNPCRELWEDVAGRRAAPRDAPARPGEAADNPALVLWGRPGREHNAALVDLVQGDFVDRFADPTEGAAPTALRRLQRDILDRAPRRAAADRPPRADASADDSVRVLACPGLRRELEVIAGEIAALLVSDPTLRAADVAVLLAPADHERYQAQVAAVFDEVGGIPCRLVDLPQGGESRVLEALELLLDLPLGRFARPELLGLMIHPAVLARHPDVDRDDWIRWCDELGIVHGADRRDHRGTYIGQDLYNWDQGLRRLALGSFMAHDPERGPIAVRLGAESYVPARVATDERRSAARFALLARSLVADARACRAADRPLAAWGLHLDRLATTYLGALGPADERALDRCRECLRQLAALDLDGRAVSYATARELLREPLAALHAAGADLPTDAVLVAPLAPMRPVPFRVVFVAGLDAGRFPAAEHESGFDLRAGTRRAGDVTPRDRDRYAFLEALLSARDRLVLSYVARDEESGEELEPSSVVHELTEMLVEGYLAPEDAAALVVRHPLRRWTSPAGLDRVSRRQAACAELRRDLAVHCAAAGAPVPDREALERELARPERADLAERLGLPETSPRSPLLHVPFASGRLAAARPGEPLVLSIAALRKFLECPLQAWASAVLGLRTVDDEDLVARRDEPFERDLLTLTMTLREVFLAHLERGGDAAALFRLHRERSLRDQQAGCAPIGPFATGAERRGARILARWRAGLAGAAGGLPAARVVGFGAVAEGERVASLEPAIELEAAGRPVRLIGRTEPLAGAAGSVVLVTGDTPNERHWLRGAMDAVTLAAAGLGPAEGHVVTLVAGSGKVEQVRFQPIDERAARAWLSDTVAELFGRTHDYLLPCEAALPHARGTDDTPLPAAVARLVDRDRFFSSRGGPLRLPRGLAPPPDADALLARRLGIWLERARPEGDADV